jgi:hypothetical protein
MTKTRIAVLAATFLFAFNFPPWWVVDNFFFKIEILNDLPFGASYFLHRFVVAIVTTILVELLIRFIKRHA